MSDLAARHGILDTLALFCERVDEYDIEAVVELFTEDCLTDYGPGRGGEVRGRPALMKRLRSGQGQFRRTHHQLGQSRIVVEADAATAVTYVTAWHELWNGQRESARLRYLDGFRLLEGRWLISERRVHAAGIEGFEGVPWVWVPRRRPPPEHRER